MPKVSRDTQEDIIWWMRNKMAAETAETESMDSSTRLLSMATDDTSDYTRTSKRNPEYEESVISITSLLPDEVIYNLEKFTPQIYQCSIMIGGIVGYAELYDYHSKMEHSNAQQFTANMNTYLTVVFDEILKHNGDILLCTGKSFLVMWKTKQSMTQQNSLQMALDCAISIIKECPKHEVTDNITLSVKMGVASGEILFSFLGTKKGAHFIFFGPSIDEANNAKDQAKPGQIILNRKSTAYLVPSTYVFEHVRHEYLRVLGSGQEWKHGGSLYDDDLQTDHKIVSMMLPSSSQGALQLMKLLREKRQGLSRACMNHVATQKLKDSLLKFIPPTIVHALTVSESLHHLTESRLIVSIYINVTIGRGTLLEQFLTISECYQITCSEMCKLGGNICKVTCRNNALILLVAFGLRGFKHTLESKRALLCSMNCFKGLKTLKKVRHISIGISTGLTFCGVVGHNLRRNFSLIGRVVHTASELMARYSDRITCDRETFLQSRLEARNFIFQESNHLDIKDFGPIYEYIEYTGLSFYPRSILSMFPILGRCYELNLYNKIVEQNLSNRKLQYYNALIILGEPRSGKSRLIEEFLFITPPETSIFRIKLLCADKIPYKCIFKIFGNSLDFSETNSAQRKVKLKSATKNLPVPELVGLLNDIFDVNFPHSDLLKSFTSEERDIALFKLIKEISYFCFSKSWTILIDDGNNIDDESWPLINAILETNNVFMVITMSEEEKRSKGADVLFKHPLCKKLRLRPISKWYYTGLACQILQVFGIAKELDQVLQEKSQGNPGWIENFLISLVQGGYINVSTIPKSKIGNFNLTLASEEMIARTEDNQNIMDSVISSNRGNIISLGERWNSIFRGVFEERKTSTTSANILNRASEVKHNNDEMVDICLVEPNMNINDVYPEIISDSNIIKILDSLSLQEHSFLKVSSVIGDIVPREMAFDILNNITEKETCLAVVKFFKLGIFGCARGNFESVYKNAALNRKSVRETNDLVCDCKGLDISHISVRFENLPQYAYCGLMHFKMPLIREVIYGSLSSVQIYEYHSKSVVYLEERMKKCKVCGGGQFNKILGKRYGSDLQAIMKNKSFVKHMKSTKSWDLLNLLPMKFPMSTSFIPKYSVNKMRKSKIGLRDTSLRGSRDIVDGHKLPRGKLIKRYQFRESLTTSFSKLNFSNCYCNNILNSFYDQMISHYFALNEMDKWMVIVFEYSHLCIELNNIPLSNLLLEKALVELETKRFTEHVKRGEEWKLSIIKARIYTLMGYGMLKLGHHKVSHEYLMKALNNYGVKFPKKGTIGHKMKQIEQNLHIAFGSHVAKNTVPHQYQAEYYDNLSDCLSITYELFAEMELWENAEIAAIWSLQKALMSGRDFRTIIRGFSNTIRSLLVNKKLKSVLGFEIRSLLYCKLHNINHINAMDLKVVLTLYIQIFYARVLRGELMKAIDLGKAIGKLLPAVNIHYDYMNIFPVFIYILIVKKKFKEMAHQMATVLNALGEKILHKGSGPTWYYGLCLVIQIETSSIVESYDTCVTHYFSNTIPQTTTEEKSSEIRFFVCLWLWCLRRGKYEDADMWEAQVRKRIKILKLGGTPIFNITTSMYFLEALILKYVHKLNCHATEEGMSLNSEIDMMISNLIKQARGTFIQPRLEHLKAYYVLSKYGELRAFAILKNAKKLAKVADFSYEVDYIKHSEMAWNHELSDTDLTRWRSDNNNVFLELSQDDISVGHYTFEPPLYF